MSLDAERGGLLAEIHEAFAGVTLGKGVSWNESFVIDDYGTAEEAAAARVTDAHKHWSEYATDADWYQCGCGGFSFLDREGFRFYLPAAMVQEVIGNATRGSLCFHLTVNKTSRYAMSQTSLLDERQVACVARFIRYMIACAKQNDSDLESESWQEALDCGRWT